MGAVSRAFWGIVLMFASLPLFPTFALTTPKGPRAIVAGYLALFHRHFVGINSESYMKLVPHFRVLMMENDHYVRLIMHAVGLGLLASYCIVISAIMVAVAGSSATGTSSGIVVAFSGGAVLAAIALFSSFMFLMATWRSRSLRTIDDPRSHAKFNLLNVTFVVFRIIDFVQLIVVVFGNRRMEAASNHGVSQPVDVLSTSFDGEQVFTISFALKGAIGALCILALPRILYIAYYKSSGDGRLLSYGERFAVKLVMEFVYMTMCITSAQGFQCTYKREVRPPRELYYFDPVPTWKCFEEPHMYVLLTSFLILLMYVLPVPACRVALISESDSTMVDEDEHFRMSPAFVGTELMIKAIVAITAVVLNTRPFWVLLVACPLFFALGVLALKTPTCSVAWMRFTIGYSYLAIFATALISLLYLEEGSLLMLNAHNDWPFFGLWVAVMIVVAVVVKVFTSNKALLPMGERAVLASGTFDWMRDVGYVTRNRIRTLGSSIPRSAMCNVMIRDKALLSRIYNAFETEPLDHSPATCGIPRRALIPRTFRSKQGAETVVCTALSASTCVWCSKRAVQDGRTVRFEYIGCVVTDLGSLLNPCTWSMGFDEPLSMWIWGNTVTAAYGQGNFQSWSLSLFSHPTLASAVATVASVSVHPRASADPSKVDVTLPVPTFDDSNPEEVAPACDMQAPPFVVFLEDDQKTLRLQPNHDELLNLFGRPQEAYVRRLFYVLYIEGSEKREFVHRRRLLKKTDTSIMLHQFQTEVELFLSLPNGRVPFAVARDVDAEVDTAIRVSVLLRECGSARPFVVSFWVTEWFVDFDGRPQDIPLDNGPCPLKIHVPAECGAPAKLETNLYAAGLLDVNGKIFVAALDEGVGGHWTLSDNGHRYFSWTLGAFGFGDDDLLAEKTLEKMEKLRALSRKSASLSRLSPQIAPYESYTRPEPANEEEQELAHSVLRNGKPAHDVPEFAVERQRYSFYPLPYSLESGHQIVDFSMGGSRAVCVVRGAYAPEIIGSCADAGEQIAGDDVDDSDDNNASGKLNERKNGHKQQQQQQKERRLQESYFLYWGACGDNNLFERISVTEHFTPFLAQRGDIGYAADLANVLSHVRNSKNLSGRQVHMKTRVKVNVLPNFWRIKSDAVKCHLCSQSIPPTSAFGYFYRTIILPPTVNKTKNGSILCNQCRYRVEYTDPWEDQHEVFWTHVRSDEPFHSLPAIFLSDDNCPSVPAWLSSIVRGKGVPRLGDLQNDTALEELLSYFLYTPDATKAENADDQGQAESKSSQDEAKQQIQRIRSLKAALEGLGQYSESEGSAKVDIEMTPLIVAVRQEIEDIWDTIGGLQTCTYKCARAWIRSVEVKSRDLEAYKEGLLIDYQKSETTSMANRILPKKLSISTSIFAGTQFANKFVLSERIEGIADLYDSPHALPAAASIVKIVCGNEHVVMLDKEGNIFVSGSSVSPLGFKVRSDAQRNFVVPVVVRHPHYGRLRAPEHASEEEKDFLTIRDVWCGPDYSIMQNKLSDLCLSCNGVIAQIDGLDLLEDANSDGSYLVACGKTFFAISRRGSPFVLIRGDVLGDEENDGFVQSVTLKLPFDSTLGVQSMAAGSHHLMVATQCGKLLAYGANGDGQLGLGPQERNAMVLKQVCLSSLVCLRPPKGESSTPDQREGEPWMAGYVRRVISHACGESHTIVLTEEADRDDPNITQRIVWTFGQGNFGALGTGCRLDAFYPQAVWCRHWGLPISMPDVVYYRPLSEVIMTPKWWDIGGHIGKLLLKTSGRDKKRSMKVGPTRVGAGPRQSVVYCDKQGDVYVFGDDCYHAFGFGAVRFSIYDRPKLCGSISTPWTHVESLTFTECGSFALVAPKPLLQ